MADIVCNAAKGRVIEFYKRVKTNDPANSALIAVPLETAGLEADSVLEDKNTLADLLGGATNEQTTLGRVVFTDAELAAFPAPDDINNRYSVALPDFGYIAAAGNPISKLLICYNPDTVGATDADITPCVVLDFALTPDGNDVSVTGGDFYRST